MWRYSLNRSEFKIAQDGFYNDLYLVRQQIRKHKQKIHFINITPLGALHLVEVRVLQFI